MADSDMSYVPSEQEPPTRDVYGWKWFVVVVSLLHSTFLFSLDSTIVGDIQPAIFKSFGEVQTLTWLGVSFALGSATTILPWCKAYGAFNMKWLYLFHILLFHAGSVLCGCAQTMDALVVGRAITGVGGCGMFIGTLTILSSTTSFFDRPIYLGATGIVWAVGIILGPLVGGVFADSKATWRWAFLINPVSCAIFAPAYFSMLPSISLPVRAAWKQKILWMTDWLGIISLIFFMTSLVMAIHLGGTVYEWNSGPEIALWVLSAILFPVFCATQIYHPLVAPQHKLYPTHILKRPVLVLLQITAFCGSGCTFAAAYYIPLLFQFARDDTALQAAVHLLPFICMLVLFALLNGALMPRYGYYMPWYLFGGACVVAGSALMYTLDSKTSASTVYAYSALIGIGAGSYLQADYGVSQALLGPESIPNAVGFTAVGQNVGVAVFLAIAGAVFNNQAVKSLAHLLPHMAESKMKEAIAGTSGEIFATLDDVTKAEVLEAIVQSIGKTFGVVLAGGALTVVMALFMPMQKLSFGRTFTISVNR